LHFEFDFFLRWAPAAFWAGSEKKISAGGKKKSGWRVHHFFVLRQPFLRCDDDFFLIARLRASPHATRRPAERGGDRPRRSAKPHAIIVWRQRQPVSGNGLLWGAYSQGWVCGFFRIFGRFGHSPEKTRRHKAPRRPLAHRNDTQAAFSPDYRAGARTPAN